MIKPDKGLSLGIEALVAFFAGCEPWLPKNYDFYKKVFQFQWNGLATNMAWNAELRMQPQIRSAT